MGGHSGTFEESFARFSTEKRAHAGRGLVGGTERNAKQNFTVINWSDDAGAYVFGEEIAATETILMRPLPRGGSDHSSDYAYLRIEFEFEKSDMEKFGLGAGATAFWVDVPGGFKSVFRANVQSYAGKVKREKYPEYDERLLTPKRQKENPCDFTMDDHEQRRSTGDLAAIARVSSADRDIYLSDHKKLRASFASDKVVNCFFPHQQQARWAGFRASTYRKESPPRKRFGIVHDADEVKVFAYEALAKEHEKLNKIINDNGFYPIGGQPIQLHSKLTDYLDDTLILSVAQAMGGLDGDEDQFLGQPIHRLAYFYFLDHIANINRFLVRRDKGQKDTHDDENQPSDPIGAAPLDAEERLLAIEELQYQEKELLKKIADNSNPKFEETLSYVRNRLASLSRGH